MSPAATVELLAMQAGVAAMLYDLDQGARLHSVCRATQLLGALLEQSGEILAGRRELGEEFARLRAAGANMARHARAEQRSAEA